MPLGFGFLVAALLIASALFLLGLIAAVVARLDVARSRLAAVAQALESDRPKLQAQLERLRDELPPARIATETADE
ncbi:MAG TPA: hypothetical protein VK592_10735 [Candidatus Dormibacteraeota bacterium]|nr:hypothetical protein [Candidatus Dormibacteraeota bacterium]